MAKAPVWFFGWKALAYCSPSLKRAEYSTTTFWSPVADTWPIYGRNILAYPFPVPVVSRKNVFPASSAICAAPPLWILVASIPKGSLPVMSFSKSRYTLYVTPSCVRWSEPDRVASASTRAFRAWLNCSSVIFPSADSSSAWTNAAKRALYADWL
ncbi:hypothetical protein D3C75_780880 [compost metagenome]